MDQCSSLDITLVSLWMKAEISGIYLMMLLYTKIRLELPYEAMTEAYIVLYKKSHIAVHNNEKMTNGNDKDNENSIETSSGLVETMAGNEEENTRTMDINENTVDEGFHDPVSRNSKTNELYIVSPRIRIGMMKIQLKLVLELWKND